TTLVAIISLFLCCLVLQGFVLTPASQGPQRFSYVIGENTRSIAFAHDDTAAESITSTTFLPVGEITVYKLNSEPLGRYILPRRVYQYFTISASNWNIAGAQLEFSVQQQWL